jgi:hypothetical protein
LGYHTIARIDNLIHQTSTMAKRCPASASFVANLNNNAAVLMRNAEYSRAVIILSSALVGMKKGIRQNTITVPRTEPIDSFLLGPPCDFLKCEAGGNSVDQTAFAFETDQVTTATDEYFLCIEPIKVFAEVAATSPCILDILSYAILYNLALCHHLKAISTPPFTTDDTPNLQRAITFYNHAQQLLVKFHHNMDVFHSLAISNNLGHAHHFLHNEPTAQLCFQRLLNVIMYISESGPDGQTFVANHEFCFEGFLTNVMHMTGFSPSAPAA